MTRKRQLPAAAVRYQPGITASPCGRPPPGPEGAARAPTAEGSSRRDSATGCSYPAGRGRHQTWRGGALAESKTGGKGSHPETRSIRLMSATRLSRMIRCMTFKRMINMLDNLRGPLQSVPVSSAVVTRHARHDEAGALAALAELDSSRAPRGEVIVADVQGELWAAVSVDDGHAVANPFRPSGALAFRLSGRARELHRAGRHTTRRPRGGRPRLTRVEAA